MWENVDSIYFPDLFLSSEGMYVKNYYNGDWGTLILMCFSFIDIIMVVSKVRLVD